MVHELSKAYQPELTEGRLYDSWLKTGLFKAGIQEGKTPFVIVIPPPNITGSLHMGHALDNTLQDLLIRWHKMSGDPTLWLPGIDHAGIATQAVVEKTLAKEGIKRHSLGREKFLEKVWEWKEKYGNTIIMQLQRLGAACDWSRQRFTMDREYSQAVKTAFVHLYKKGYVYQGERIINWCIHCHTAISDLEVEYQEEKGKLYYVTYPCWDNSGTITIATTRPETILADTAVAVHPDDERYKHLIGKELRLPVLGRKIPVIADAYVEREFGTGALKITPAHDPNDFEVGERHNLPVIKCFDDRGKMNQEAGPYQGLSREECRKAIVEDLKASGLLLKEEEYLHAVNHCSRCHTVVEPYITPQWFLSMRPLASPAIEAVESGAVRFIPERFGKIYLNWMENIKDWCISRQLWWGHRIPIWTCNDCKFQDAYIEAPDKCPQCGGGMLQEEDVLDTWFSSGLWPFATLGWPEQTQDLQYFYPTSVLVTGRDIIFLWVARMIMLGLEFMGKVPFSSVCIHSTILAKSGKRMSKSLGTGVDPLELFQNFGTDATRFGLILQTEQGQDIKFSEDRIEMSRNFCNKIWNAVRFSLPFLDAAPDYVAPDSLSLADRWILSRLQTLVAEAHEGLTNFEFHRLARAAYNFFWDEFCDWYLEIIKPSLYGPESQSKAASAWVLNRVFRTFLPLIHPVMPFISEELWLNLPGANPSLLTVSYPMAQMAQRDPEAESRMVLFMDFVRGLRNLRMELGIAPKDETEVLLEPEWESWLHSTESKFAKELVKISRFNLIPLERWPKHSLRSMVDGKLLGIEETALQIEKILERLRKEQSRIEQEKTKLEQELQNPGFKAKAPQLYNNKLERSLELQDKAEKIKAEIAKYS